MTFGIIGVFYGIAINIPSVIWVTIGAVSYGLLGVLVGVPTAGVFNMIRISPSKHPDYESPIPRLVKIQCVFIW